MQSNSPGSKRANSAASASANPPSGVARRRLGIFWAVMRNLPKLANVVPPARVKAVQRLRERLDIPTRTHETLQPFDLSPRLSTRVRKLGL